MMSAILSVFAIFQILSANVLALLNGMTTPTSSPSLETQIIQILNKESLLRLELEKEIHALKSKVESLESSAQQDKKTIGNLTSAMADAEGRERKLDDEIKQLKAFVVNNNQSLLHLNNVLTNISNVVGQRLQYLEQQLPTLARKEPSIAFLVHLSHNRPTHPGPVVFDSANLNIGNAYNTNNGIFTAPVAGLYSFSATLAGDYGDVHGNIKQNGQNTGYVFADDIGSTKFQRASLSITLHCNKGDRVWFDSEDNGNQIIYGNDYTWFSGYLVHMDQ